MGGFGGVVFASSRCSPGFITSVDPLSDDVSAGRDEEVDEEPIGVLSANVFRRLNSLLAASLVGEVSWSRVLKSGVDFM